MRRKIKPWEHIEVEESGDEQWIMSYADMVTLLFGFFVILYSFSTMDEKKFDQMGEKLASAFKAPESIDKKTTADVGITNEARQIRALQLLVAMLNLGENTDQAVRKIESAAASKTELDAAKSMLQESIKHDRNISMIQSKSPESPTVEIVMPEGLLFAAGQAELSITAKAKIQKLGRDFLKIEGIDKIEVVGHTDSLPPGPAALFKSNFALSSARAGAVAQELLNSGVRKELVMVKGMGDLEPQQVEPKDKLTKSKASDMSINRRVNIILRKVNRRD